MQHIYIELNAISYICFYFLLFCYNIFHTFYNSKSKHLLSLQIAMVEILQIAMLGIHVFEELVNHILQKVSYFSVFKP